MTFDATTVCHKSRRLFWLTPFPENKAVVSICQISLAQLLHGNRVAVESSVFGRVVTLGDATEKRTCLPASFFWRPDAVQANCQPPGSALGSVLNQITAFAGCENPKPEPWQLVIPEKVIGIFGPDSIDGTLGQFGRFFDPCGCSERASAEAWRKQRDGNRGVFPRIGFGAKYG